MSSESPACQELRGKIPTDWEVGLLGAVTDFQEGPGILAKDFKDSGVPLLRLRNIEGQRVQLAGCNFLDPEKVTAKWSHFGLRQGDLLISTSASLGRVSVVGPESVGAIAYTGIIRFRSRSPLLHHEYLRAFLSSKTFVEQAEKMATGSVIKHFGPSHLRQMAITLPPLETQVQIAEIFDVLDDRITLLRESNATLEAITQALFKSWFVDFDPVRAKMAGRAPEGMDVATAALFPDALEETELGLVPKGWQLCCVDDVAALKGGKQLEKECFKSDGLYPVFGGAGVMGRSDSFNAEGFVITVGRVGAYCGQYFWTQGKAWVNNNASLVSAKTAAHSVWLLHWLKSVDMDVIKKGAAQPFVSNGDIAALKMALPPNDLIGQFAEVCAPIFLRLSELSSQAQTLTDLRDTLLPRLISGQFRLPEAVQALPSTLPDSRLPA